MFVEETRTMKQSATVSMAKCDDRSSIIFYLKTRHITLFSMWEWRKLYKAINIVFSILPFLYSFDAVMYLCIQLQSTKNLEFSINVAANFYYRLHLYLFIFKWYFETWYKEKKTRRIWTNIKYKAIGDNTFIPSTL